MKTTKFKQTELGPIPEDWEVKRLGEIFSFKNGYNANASCYGSGIPVASVLDALGNRPITCQSIALMVRAPGKDREAFSLKAGDLVFTRSSETLEDVGRSNVYLDEEKAMFGGFVIRGRPSVAIDSLFVNYMLNTSSSRIRVMSQGAGAQHFNIGQSGLGQVLIPLPPLLEQHRIAAALSDVDELISALGKLIEKKRNIKTGTMQQLLTGKRRLFGFGGAEFKQTELGPIPSDWEVKRLGDVATIARGGSPRPIEAYLTTDPNGVNWVKIGDVGIDAKYIVKTEERIVREGVCKSRMVFPGDFLLSNSMSFGRPYILKISGCIHDGWLVIQDYQHQFDTEFLYYILGSETVMMQYKTLAAGSSVLNLNKDVVSNVLLPILPLSEQRAIAAVLSDMDAEIAALKAEQAKYARIKSGMMQELLTGRTRFGAAKAAPSDEGKEGGR